MNALEQKVLELIGEDPDAPDVFTDDDEGIAPIRDSINECIAEIIMLTGGYRRQYFLPMRERTAFYRIRPQNGNVGWITDAWSVTQRWRLEQTDFTRLNAHDPRWMVCSGNPEAYIPIGLDVIGFYPKPSGDHDVIELTIVEIPFAYRADRDRVKLRDQFKYAVINYAVSDYWASRGDADEAQRHWQLYLDALGLNQLYQQQTERVPSVQTQKEPWPKVSG
jgi:hypothetical protein